MKTLRNSKGFTLIELIIIIIILGILSAVAIPKYINMKTDAEKATASGILAGLMGAESILFANRVLKSGTAYDLTAVVNAAGISGVTFNVLGTTGGTMSIGSSTYTVTYAPGDATTAGSFTKSW